MFFSVGHVGDSFMFVGGFMFTSSFLFNSYDLVGHVCWVEFMFTRLDSCWSAKTASFMFTDIANVGHVY